VSQPRALTRQPHLCAAASSGTTREREKEREREREREREGERARVGTANAERGVYRRTDRGLRVCTRVCTRVREKEERGPMRRDRTYGPIKEAGYRADVITVAARDRS